MADNKNEVPPKELYDTLMNMEDRIIKKIEKNTDEVSDMRVEVGVALTRIDNHEKEIDTLRKRSNILDIILAFLTVIGSAIAVALNELKLK